MTTHFRRFAFALATASLLASCSDPAPNPDDHAHDATSSSAASEDPSHDHGTHAHATGSGAGETYLPGEGMRVSQLPLAVPPRVIDVKDGDVIRIDPFMVRRDIDGAEVLQYAYNGQIPGPTIRAPQGATFVVETTNRIDQPTTIHWHGVRLENRFDGTPGLTQAPIEPNGSFRYEVYVPDAGVYWYHPHVREDVQMDLGLYGNIIVLPDGEAPENSPAPFTLLLDDILLQDDGSLMPYGKNGENYSLMGRFGNRILVNGVIRPEIASTAGTQRLYITNGANVRPFRLSIDGADMKLVGGDVGFGPGKTVDELILGPAERAIVDVTFPAPGSYSVLHRSDASTTTIANITVGNDAATPADARRADDIPTDLAAHRLREPDHTLRLVLSGGHRHGALDDSGIEWEDNMPEQNEASHGGNTAWKLIDDDTGKSNMDIVWQFARGQLVKIRVKNDYESMQHPIHFHGQRFLVISSDGQDVDDGQWKDTYQLRSGETADLLLEASNPGSWMFHCHIAEHLQNGMMGTFIVK